MDNLHKVLSLILVLIWVFTACVDATGAIIAPATSHSNDPSLVKALLGERNKTKEALLNTENEANLTEFRLLGKNTSM